MPARSEAQQKLMGMALAAKRGKGKASSKVRRIADSMSEKQLRDFAKTKHKGLPEKKAFLNGFVKRAIDYGFSENEAVKLFKKAESGWGDLDLQRFDGKVPVITAEHNPGILAHLKRNAGKYVGGGIGIPLAIYLKSQSQGYVPGTFSAATLPLLFGSGIDDIREKAHILERLHKPQSLEHLKNVVDNRTASLQALQGGLDEDIKRFSPADWRINQIKV
jgi:hypothetical protein